MKENNKPDATAASGFDMTMLLFIPGSTMMMPVVRDRNHPFFQR
jgi:hypothetical protein